MTNPRTTTIPQAEQQRPAAPTAALVVEVADVLARHGHVVLGVELLDLHLALADLLGGDR